MSTPPTVKHRFCSDCGTQLNPGARFCHNCAAPVGGRAEPAAAAPSNVSTALKWGVPIAAFFALLVLSLVQFGSRAPAAESPAGMPLGAGASGAPDISSMSPEERADRLFNRVMRLSSEGKADSAAFFGPMAMSALSALTPLDAHRRYDLGLVALVSGDVGAAAAQADSILAQRKTHLLGLTLAIRAADARSDRTASRDLRKRLLAAESSEKSSGLQEYKDHAADVEAALASARQP
jgi:hypothetical protein